MCSNLVHCRTFGKCRIHTITWETNTIWLKITVIERQIITLNMNRNNKAHWICELKEGERDKLKLKTVKFVALSSNSSDLSYRSHKIAIKSQALAFLYHI